MLNGLGGFLYTARSLAKSPLFVCVSALTLGLGIGVNTTIFSFLNGMRFRQMPVADPERLAVLVMDDRRSNVLRELSFPAFEDYRKLPVFEDMAAIQMGPASLHRGAVTDQVWLEAVSANYFSLLGLKAGRGRLFGINDERSPQLVLSYSSWMGLFGGDPKIIGSEARLNGQTFTIVGVTPETYHGAISFLDTDGFVPVRAPGLQIDVDHRASASFRTLARLKPAVSLEQARAATAVLAGNLSKQYPATDATLTSELLSEPDARPDPSARAMITAMAASGAVLVVMLLLIACANIANLMLVRTFNRSREMAIRASLGASRTSLLAIVYKESLLLAAFGLMLGILISGWITNLLASYRPGVDFRFRSDYSFDGRVLAFTIAAAFLTAVVCGSVPAFQMSGWDLNLVIKQSTGTPSSVRMRWSWALVVAQVAVSVLLLICCGLFVRGLAYTQHMNLGYRVEDRAVMSFNLGRQHYADSQARAELKRLVDSVKTIPGVESAAFVEYLPFAGSSNSLVFRQDELLDEQKGGHPAMSNVVGANYFHTMGSRLLEGREFSAHDDATGKPVVIVNEALADSLWKRGTAVGQKLRLSAHEVREVIGVVETGKYFSLAEAPRPWYFVPLEQHPLIAGSLVARSNLPASQLMSLLRASVRQVDPELPVYNVMSLEHLVRDSYVFGPIKVGTEVAAAFGVAGLILAAIGIYGVISYSVNTRTRDIGIRLSLGATRNAVLANVMRQGMTLVVCGLLGGVAGALALRGLLSKVLVGVSPGDPATFLTVASMVLMVGALACYLPSRRAASVDPVIALRAD